jgi:ribonuclease HI
VQGVPHTTTSTPPPPREEPDRLGDPGEDDVAYDLTPPDHDASDSHLSWEAHLLGDSDPDDHLYEEDADGVVDLTSPSPMPQRSPPSPPPSPPPPPPPPARKGKKAKTPKPDLLAVPALEHEALGAADYISASMLAFPAPGKKLLPDTRARAVAAMALFNGVVWFERCYYFKMMSTPPPLEEATNWLADVAALDHLSAFGPKVARGLGSAGKRTAAQKKAAVAYGLRIINSIPPLSIVAFTDGAANPNPGPSGAGAYIYDNLPVRWDTELTAALGLGSNNLGELWAIGLALEAALAHILAHPHAHKHLFIYTDSQFTRGVLTLGWRSNSHPVLARRLKQLVRDFPIGVTIDWVPAHVGLNSNERADELAAAGAVRSKEQGPDDFAEGSFTPLFYEG